MYRQNPKTAYSQLFESDKANVLRIINIMRILMPRMRLDPSEKILSRLMKLSGVV